MIARMSLVIVNIANPGVQRWFKHLHAPANAPVELPTGQVPAWQDSAAGRLENAGRNFSRVPSSEFRHGVSRQFPGERSDCLQSAPKIFNIMNRANSSCRLRRCRQFRTHHHTSSRSDQYRVAASDPIRRYGCILSHDFSGKVSLRFGLSLELLLIARGADPCAVGELPHRPGRRLPSCDRRISSTMSPVTADVDRIRSRDAAFTTSRAVHNFEFPCAPSRWNLYGAPPWSLDYSSGLFSRVRIAKPASTSEQKSGFEQSFALRRRVWCMPAPE